MTLDLDKMEAVGLMLPNVEVRVVHHFGPGLYMREAVLPVGFYLGRAHREPCQNIMIAGCLSLLTPNGWQTLRAPQTFTGQPGRKLAIVHEPTVWVNVWATTETDLGVLEQTLFDDSAYMVEWRDAVMRFAGNRAQPDRDDFAAFVAASPWTVDEVRALSERTDDVVPMPEPWSSTLQVLDSPIEGKGLFTSSHIKAGAVVAPARINGQRTPAGRFVNHSRTPNAAMVAGGAGAIDVVALRDIAGCHGGDSGEEITVDYRQAVIVGGQS
jgi:hypothetical protein